MNLTLTPSVAPEEIIDVYRAAEDLRRIRHLAGPLPSVHPRIEAALHGLLAKVRDLGLPLISVRRLDV